MFDTSGKKAYLVSKIHTGTARTGKPFTIISIEDEVRQNQKFPDKACVCIWGEDIGAKVKQGNYISISGTVEVGLQFKKGQADPTKFYPQLNLTCTSHHIHLSAMSELEDSNPLDFAQDDLPF